VPRIKAFAFLKVAYDQARVINHKIFCEKQAAIMISAEACSQAAQLVPSGDRYIHNENLTGVPKLSSILCNRLIV
jgi:hypothetical protein